MADGHPRAPHRGAQEASEACPPAPADEYLRAAAVCAPSPLRRAILTRSLSNSDVSGSVALRGRSPPGRPRPDWYRGQVGRPGWFREDSLQKLTPVSPTRRPDHPDAERVSVFEVYRWRAPMVRPASRASCRSYVGSWPLPRGCASENGRSKPEMLETHLLTPCRQAHRHVCLARPCGGRGLPRFAGQR
jgi:hypothetical protein